MVAKRNLKKMTFLLDARMWHGSATETIWVAPLGGRDYRLENSPFYAFGISYQDIARGKEEAGSVLFDGVVSTGGHSTYRIIKNKDASSQFEKYWLPLHGIGCTFEEGIDGLLSVDIPPRTDIHAAYELLERGELNEAWTFEEAHCGHSIKGSAQD